VKILLSAFECAPNIGSEAGIGWNWALELARSGHQVWVFTSGFSKRIIKASEKHGLVLPKGLHFVYLDLLATDVFGWGIWGKDNRRFERTRNYIWQLLVWRRAKKWHQKVHFDVAHHLTWGGLRSPSLMGLLGVPFIYGPVGGGELAPFSLFREMSPPGKFIEGLRYIANKLIWLDPVIWLTYSSADLVYAKTAETKAALPRIIQHKVFIRQEIGIDPLNCQQKKGDAALYDGEFRLLFAGRLLHMKGLGLALKALSKLLQEGANVCFTIVGSGPERKRLGKLCSALGIDDRVNWIDRVPQTEMLAAYRKYDALLFPSTHDSSGNVVLEAMCHGLPVICLDLGGPPMVVGDAGLVVDVTGKNADEVVQDLSIAIKLLSSEKLRAKLREASIQRASNYSWSLIVGSFYEDVSQKLGIMERKPEKRNKIPDNK